MNLTHAVSACRYVMSLEFAFLLLAAWDFMGGKKKNGKHNSWE